MYFTIRNIYTVPQWSLDKYWHSDAGTVFLCHKVLKIREAQGSICDLLDHKYRPPGCRSQISRWIRPLFLPDLCILWHTQETFWIPWHRYTLRYEIWDTFFTSWEQVASWQISGWVGTGCVMACSKEVAYLPLHMTHSAHWPPTTAITQTSITAPQCQYSLLSDLPFASIYVPIHHRECSHSTYCVSQWSWVRAIQAGFQKNV